MSAKELDRSIPTNTPAGVMASRDLIEAVDRAVFSVPHLPVSRVELPAIGDFVPKGVRSTLEKMAGSKLIRGLAASTAGGAAFFGVAATFDNHPSKAQEDHLEHVMASQNAAMYRSVSEFEIREQRDSQLENRQAAKEQTKATRTVVIQKGESVTSAAQRSFGLDANEAYQLVSEAGLADKNVVYAGDQIEFPDESVTAAKGGKPTGKDKVPGNKPDNDGKEDSHKDEKDENDDEHDGKKTEPGPDPNPETEHEKVDICHRTNSVKNPYVKIEVDVHAFDGVAGNSGSEPDHFGEHQGPIASSEAVAQELKDNKTEWGDIGKPVDGRHDGANWTRDGQTILENDCKLPEATPTTEPTETATPNPTNTASPEPTKEKTPVVPGKPPKFEPSRTPTNSSTPTASLSPSASPTPRVELPFSGKGNKEDKDVPIWAIAAIALGVAGLGVAKIGLDFKNALRFLGQDDEEEDEFGNKVVKIQDKRKEKKDGKSK